MFVICLRTLQDTEDNSYLLSKVLVNAGLFSFVFIYSATEIKLSILIFLHFRVQYDFLTCLAKFQSITNIRSHSVFTFISENLRPPLLDLVPRLGCELEKMTSYEQKYLTG